MNSRWHAKCTELLDIVFVLVAVYSWIVFMVRASSESQAVFGRALPWEI